MADVRGNDPIRVQLSALIGLASGVFLGAQMR
jgi:hypothetical protein